ncbi:MAG: pantetheine-phosphate adenylyltransferase [Acidimicrobiales bacterium]
MPAALLPGSFDPFHNGHLAVVRVAASLFDTVVVAIGYNPAKPSGMFTVDERKEMIVESVVDLKNVQVTAFEGLVTTAATLHQADVLVKGIRTSTDLDSEMVQANTNGVTGGIQTLFVPGVGAAALVASRYLREIGIRGGDISPLVPQPVWDAMQRKTGALGQ